MSNDTDGVVLRSSPCHLENLPPELLHEILGSIPDLYSCGSLIKASKKYYGAFTKSKEYFLNKILLGELRSPSIIRVAKAVAIGASASGESSKAAEVLLQNDSSTDTEELPLPLLSQLCLNHMLVRDFVNMMPQARLSHHPLTGEATDGYLPLTDSELQRLYGAFYGVWAYFYMFSYLRRSGYLRIPEHEWPDIEDCTSLRAKRFFEMPPSLREDDVLTPRQRGLDNLEAFLDSLTKWEREEMLIVYRFLFEEIKKRALFAFEHSPLYTARIHKLTRKYAVGMKFEEKGLGAKYEFITTGQYPLDWSVFGMMEQGFPRVWIFLFRYSPSERGKVLLGTTKLKDRSDGDLCDVVWRDGYADCTDRLPLRRICKVAGVEPWEDWASNCVKDRDSNVINLDVAIWDDWRLESWGYYFCDMEFRDPTLGRDWWGV